MKRKLSTILAVLMIALLTFSTADAGGGIKLSAGFKLGSLIADGFLQGTGEEPVTVVLTATGTCNNEQVSAIGTQVLTEDEETESDTRQFHVETNNPGDCSNDTESQNGFVFWTKASISVFSGEICGESCEGLLSSAAQASNTLLVQQDYNCTTSFDAHTVSCTPVKNKGSNNGTTAICHATGSNKHPYVLLKVNGNGLNGHSKHTGDIIPAPADGCPK